MANSASDAPAGIVTVAGTDAVLALVDESEIDAPPAGATPESDTRFPGTAAPLSRIKDAGDSADRVTVGVMDRSAVFVAPPYTAVTVTVFGTTCAVVWIVNRADKEPCGTVTLAGTEAN
jgi:hypothetical protein